MSQTPNDPTRDIMQETVRIAIDASERRWTEWNREMAGMAEDIHGIMVEQQSLRNTVARIETHMAWMMKLGGVLGGIGATAVTTLIVKALMGP